MKKNINLSVPAIEESYDVLIPSFMTVGELTPMLAKAVEELSNNSYVSSGQ